jgi:hypothetical protein
MRKSRDVMGRCWALGGVVGIHDFLLFSPVVFFTAKHIDAFADGALVLVCGGILSCKHNESF